VGELQALVAPKPPQGVLVRGHAGLVINKLSSGVEALGDGGGGTRHDAQLPDREIGISLPENQRQHRTLHIQDDVLPYALC